MTGNERDTRGRRVGVQRVLTGDSRGAGIEIEDRETTRDHRGTPKEIIGDRFTRNGNGRFSFFARDRMMGNIGRARAIEPRESAFRWLF